MKFPLWMSIVLGLIVCSASAQAESWVFNRSYYSHDPVSQVRIGKQYSPGIVFTKPYGQYIKSGFRYNRSSIQIPGQVYDNTNQYESWYQVGSQF